MMRPFRNTILTALFCSLLFTTSALAIENIADYTDPVSGMEFVSIPGGVFVMGNNNDKYATPEHEVTVKPFLLGRYEVTFEQYANFCSNTGRLIPPEAIGDTSLHPAYNITWQDAVDFTAWLSEKSGKSFRLPSETEWEHAARGGATTKYPWGDEVGENLANCANCGSPWQTTSPVGSYAANGYGLFDMGGNVYEWCLDVQNDNYQGAPTDGSAWLTGNEEFRVNRGGSWVRKAKELPITKRCWDQTTRRNPELGFRVLMER